MRLLRVSSWYVLIAIIAIVAAVLLLLKVLFPATPSWITTTVERGEVNQLVSVSGFVEAKELADLAFPSSGVVTDILVSEGSRVKTGDILATLAATELVAERTRAASSLLAAEAAYQEVIRGPRQEAVTVANTSLATAKANLARVTLEEERKVNNARAALLSTGLTALATDPDEDSAAPVITGTYICTEEGTYTLSVYNSGAESGYSYTYSGLESGTSIVSTEQPAPLGTCGLYIQFTAGDTYGNSAWTISIPNTLSSSYTTLRNTYNLTRTQAENAIAAAENALALAESENTLTLAPARSETVLQAEAKVSEARAAVAAIDARIIDRSIAAPFAGVVTNVSITKGESTPATPVISVLAEDAFLLKARIPEIDITKILVGQTATAIFDARSNETLRGTISYVSPIAEQIDGVAYFTVHIDLAESPNWLRAGLNADVDIVVEKRSDVLRLPKRFVFTDSTGTPAVLLPRGTVTATSTIEVLFTGNDSYVEVSGIAEGTEVIAP